MRRNSMKLKWATTIVTAAVMLALAPMQTRAQDGSSAAKTVTLYVDHRTKQVFLEPGRNRVPIKLLGELDTDALADEVQKRVSDKTHSEVVNVVAQSQANEAAQRHALEQQVADMKPAW